MDDLAIEDYFLIDCVPPLVRCRRGRRRVVASLPVPHKCLLCQGLQRHMSGVCQFADVANVSSVGYTIQSGSHTL